jgi:hypothetical protein
VAAKVTVAMISYFIFSFDLGVLVTVLSKFNYSDYKKGVKKLKTQSMLRYVLQMENFTANYDVAFITILYNNQ